MLGVFGIMIQQVIDYISCPHGGAAANIECVKSCLLTTCEVGFFRHGDDRAV